MAPAWKTQNDAFPGQGVLGHQFVVSNTAGLTGLSTESKLKRLKHDEYSHDINRGVSAG
jgi:hypothetical protein